MSFPSFHLSISLEEGNYSEFRFSLVHAFHMIYFPSYYHYWPCFDAFAVQVLRGWEVGEEPAGDEHFGGDSEVIMILVRGMFAGADGPD